MAITIKKKQALSFTTKDACYCGNDYCQPVQISDTINLQGATTIAVGGAGNLVQDAAFDTDVAGPGASFAWDLDTNWDIATGKLIATGVSAGQDAQSFSPLHLSANKFYVVQADVFVVSTGDWRIKVNGDYMPLPGETLGAYTDVSRTITWIYKPTSITTDIVVFEVDGGIIQFLYFNIYEFSTVGVALYDLDGNLIDDGGGLSGSNSIAYYMQDDSVFAGPAVIYTSGETTLQAIQLMFNIFISNIGAITGDTGCMQMRVYDSVFSSERIRNGTFGTDLSYWEAGDHWDWDSNHARYQGDGLTAGTLCQEVNLLGGSIYDFSFFLGGVGLSGNCVVLIDYNDGGGSQTLGTFTGVGTQTATIDMTGFTGPQQVIICFAEGNDQTFTIDTVSITSEPDPLNTSNCINLQETHDCTLYFHGNNNDNAFDLDYESSSYQQYIRAYSRMRVSGYPEDTEVFPFSDNSYRIMFAKNEKEYDVIIGDAAEHVHDLLSIIRNHDTFDITRLLEDGTTETITMISSGDYDLKTRKQSYLMQANFNVKERQGVGSNYSCS